MSRAPRVTGLELITALANAGFGVLRVLAGAPRIRRGLTGCVHRIKGSNHFLRHKDWTAATVSNRDNLYSGCPAPKDNHERKPPQNHTARAKVM